MSSLIKLGGFGAQGVYEVTSITLKAVLIGSGSDFTSNNTNTEYKHLWFKNYIFTVYFHFNSWITENNW